MSYEESIDIYTQSDLDKLNQSGIINDNIAIRGEFKVSFNQIIRINGNLGLSNSNIKSLGSLEAIKGDFWISSYNFKSSLELLGKLSEIGGDAYFRYSSIKDLGNLKKVGGRLSLRDTPIENLGNLDSVGTDLFLPMRFKKDKDNLNVKVGGNIKFWNDNKDREEKLPKEKIELIKFNGIVPFWKHKYIYSNNELQYADINQKSFYKTFKQSFLRGEMIDIEGNDNYAFILFFDLIESFNSHDNISQLESQFQLLQKNYPVTSGYTQRTIIEYFEKKSDYENAWKLKYNDDSYIGIESIVDYQEKLKRPLLDAKLIINLGGYSHLTEFGQKNIENIRPFVDEQLKIYEFEKNTSFFNLFYSKGQPFQNNRKEKSFFNFLNFNKKKKETIGIDIEYYKQFYLSESEYIHYKLIDESQYKSGYKSSRFHVVEKAILSQFRLIIKFAEDLYRESIGMPKVGEGWISETELFYLISNAFSEYKVVHHASPKWLGRQHLDIYLPEFNIGIEYQGAQHYEPIDFFGGQEAFEKTKERDENKRKKCSENRCALIYVNEGYNFKEVKNKIEIIIKAKI